MNTAYLAKFVCFLFRWILTLLILSFWLFIPAHADVTAPDKGKSDRKLGADQKSGKSACFSPGELEPKNLGPKPKKFGKMVKGAASGLLGQTAGAGPLGDEAEGLKLTNAPFKKKELQTIAMGNDIEIGLLGRWVPRSLGRLFDDDEEPPKSASKLDPLFSVGINKKPVKKSNYTFTDMYLVGPDCSQHKPDQVYIFSIWEEAKFSWNVEFWQWHNEVLVEHWTRAGSEAWTNVLGSGEIPTWVGARFNNLPATDLAKDDWSLVTLWTYQDKRNIYLQPWVFNVDLQTKDDKPVKDDKETFTLPLDRLRFGFGKYDFGKYNYGKYTFDDQPSTTGDDVAPPTLTLDPPETTQTTSKDKEIDSVIDDLTPYGTTTERKKGGSTITKKPPDDGDDPRDTPPPTVYGEELDDTPIGILLVRNDKRWLPRYNNKTTVTAKLYDNIGGGWVPSTRGRIIKIEYVDRSNEKGQSLNTKLPSDPQDSPDMYLPAANNANSTCSNDTSGKGYLFGTCQTNSPTYEHRFVLGSQDFGSFSTLEASCADCVPLRPPNLPWPEGIPPTVVAANVAKKEHQVKVPKDDNNNQIGDRWIWELLQNPKATDDKDNYPQGNGVEGDGLSAYEEYRGFHTKAKHERTSPEDKDLFIHNKDNLPIDKFKKSLLTLHEVNEKELKNRVINFNHGHANVVKQHGLKLVNTKLSKGTVGTIKVGFLDTLMGRIGPPKNVDEVQVDRAQKILVLSSGTVIDGTADTVAHELGHAVMVRHHGPSDSVTEYTVIADSSVSSPVIPSGLTSLVSSTVKVAGPKLCNKYKLPKKLEFGKKHTTYSGDTKCFMRYQYGADVFIQEDGSLHCRPFEPDETDFCDSKSGGYNAGNKIIGTATRGECKKQIQVNDK